MTIYLEIEHEAPLFVETLRLKIKSNKLLFCRSNEFQFDRILPSSGQRINLNVSKSSGSGKSVLHVFGRLKSLISATECSFVFCQ